jgi:hypothetical protein
LAFGWCGAAVVVVGYWLLNGSGKVGADVCKIYENYMGKTMALGPVSCFGGVCRVVHVLYTKMFILNFKLVEVRKFEP